MNVNSSISANGFKAQSQQQGAFDNIVDKLKTASGKGMSADSAKKVAKEFESLFIGQMLEHMFQDKEENPLFGDSGSDDIYQSMMVQEYGKAISKSGGMGIAAYIERSLTQQAILNAQEVPAL